MPQAGLPIAVTSAAAMAFASAAWTARHVVAEDLDSGALLDASIGDQPTYGKANLNPVAAEEESLR